MNFTFNIIYTPGNVKHLRLFSLSILKWSDCSLRLVSNGCAPEESNMLELLCQKHKRLEFFKLPFDNIIKHGAALSYLQKLEKSDYFCFMDSDILATNNFMDDFIPYIDKYSGIFSGTAIWMKEEMQVMKKSYPRIGGRFNRTTDGLCLGSTFFAIYNNKDLTGLLDDTNITFNKYHGWNKVPDKVHEELIKLGMKAKVYDTGKLINILLESRGARLIFKHTHKLYHIGGLSSLLVGPLAAVPKKGLKRILKKIPKLLLKINRRGHAKNVITDQEKKVIKYDRRDVADYFMRNLHALFNDKPLNTALSIDDQLVMENVQKAQQEIELIYSEFKPILN